MTELERAARLNRVLQERLLAAEARIALLQHEVDVLRGARIWRLTAPLRRVIDWLRPPRGVAGPSHDTLSYARWVALHDTLDDADRAAIAAHIGQFASRPRISVVMPVFNPRAAHLRDAIASVRAQLYPDWELCIADDASTDPEIPALLNEAAEAEPRLRLVRRAVNGGIVAASNAAAALATGDYVALMDHDDVLAGHALYEVAALLQNAPDADLIYSDEDQIDANGARAMPYFKPDWNIDLMLGHNLVSHLGVYRRDLLARVGFMRDGFDGSQDYDLALRVADATTPDRIRHIPSILYHWRQDAGSFSKSRLDDCVGAARRAISAHLERTGQAGAVVGPVPQVPAWSRVRYPVPDPPPLVSVLVPTRNGAGLLRRCAEGVLHGTDYLDIELIVIDNGSTDADALALLAALREDARVRVLTVPGAFNFSALNNRAALAARGEFLVLLNNDVEVPHRDWLGELVSQASRPGIGAVGARLLYPDRTVQHAGVVLGVGGVANHFSIHEPADSPGYFGAPVLVREVGAVTAACLAVRAAHWHAVGGMDEEFLPVAFNDVDFCLKLRRRGLRNLYTPFAELIHHESATRGDDLAPEHHGRFARECRTMRERWGGELDTDPFYNPNFSRLNGNFQLLGQPGRARTWDGIAAGDS
jgi:glycosyltransferase involved in cell wall biosynthesis